MGVTHSPSAALIAHKPAVCGRNFPIACLRTASRASTASNRDENVFFRFAPFLNSAWSYHCARKLACGTPCFIGLTPRCFAHSARASCAPRLRLRGVPCLRTSCARHFSPSGLQLFASICSRKIPEMTYTPSFLMKASFFRYFVNALSREWALHMPIRGFFLCNFAPLMARA